MSGNLSLLVGSTILNMEYLEFNHHKDICFFPKIKFSKMGSMVTKGIVSKNVYTYLLGFHHSTSNQTKIHSLTAFSVSLVPQQARFKMIVSFWKDCTDLEKEATHSLKGKNWSPWNA